MRFVCIPEYPAGYPMFGSFISLGRQFRPMEVVDCITNPVFLAFRHKTLGLWVDEIGKEGLFETMKDCGDRLYSDPLLAEAFCIASAMRYTQNSPDTPFGMESDINLAAAATTVEQITELYNAGLMTVFPVDILAAFVSEEAAGVFLNRNDPDLIKKLQYVEPIRPNTTQAYLNISKALFGIEMSEEEAERRVGGGVFPDVEEPDFYDCDTPAPIPFEQQTPRNQVFMSIVCLVCALLFGVKSDKEGSEDSEADSSYIGSLQPPVVQSRIILAIMLVVSFAIIAAM